MIMDDVEFDDDCFEDCEICNNYSCPDNLYRDLDLTD